MFIGALIFNNGDVLAFQIADLCLLVLRLRQSNKLGIEVQLTSIGTFHSLVWVRLSRG